MTVLVEEVDLTEGSGAILTLNRPEARNPLDAETIAALSGQVAEHEADAHTSGLIITGAGKTFSAGGDLKSYQELYAAPEKFGAFLNEFGALCERLERGRLVSIAMVNGVCVAGGLELALACDLIVMGQGAQIGDGHIRFGQLPGAGGSQRLPRAIGVQRAKQWLLEGDLYDAEEALRVGLAGHVFPDEALRERTVSLLSKLSRSSPLGVQRMKELVVGAERRHIDEGLAWERKVVHDYATTSSDATEGLRAFIEGRNPHFVGE